MASSSKRGNPLVALDVNEDDTYFSEDPSAGLGKSSRWLEQPAATSDSTTQPPTAGEEADSFDVFMAQINEELANQKTCSSKEPVEEPLQGADPVADYFEAYTSAAQSAEGNDEEEEVGDRRNKAIEPLPPIDHTLIQYNAVQSEFYEQHPEVAALNDEGVKALRAELRISATGSNVPRPVASFAHLAESLGRELMAGIRQHGYHQPTAIQAQAIPAALSGRDVIGIAETGSGKTVAYLLPMLVHAIAQPELEKGEGPIGVVLCPTRELAVQIEEEVYKFNKRLGLKSVTLAGGLSKLEQFKEVKRGAEIAICNPGRLIDMVKMKGCTLRRVTFVVLDEADRMFSLGFEYQVRSIVQNIRPTRQTLLFSATFPPKIEKLARDLLHQPLRITVGQLGQAAANVLQEVAVLNKEEDKWAWLSKRVDGMLVKGQVLIFVKSISSAEELTQNFTDFLDKKTEFLHGDLDQGARMQILKAFRKRKVDVLIATDVAARGLDIPSIATVVSFDIARDIETHTHRIGRTGRAGAKGDAFTLLTNAPVNNKIAALLCENLEQTQQIVSRDLQTLAMKYGPYRSAKLSGQKFSGKKKGGPKVIASTFGIGFDRAATEKETPKDLEQRLNKEADKLAQVNRRVMACVGQRGRINVAAAIQSSRGPAGFVAAATSDDKIQLLNAHKPGDLSSDDDDLFAPGVTSSFGRGQARTTAPTAQQGPAPSAPQLGILAMNSLPNTNQQSGGCHQAHQAIHTQHLMPLMPQVPQAQYAMQVHNAYGTAALQASAAATVAAAAAPMAASPPMLDASANRSNSSNATVPDSLASMLGSGGGNAVGNSSGNSRSSRGSGWDVPPCHHSPQACSPRRRSPRQRSPRHRSPRRRSSRPRSPYRDRRSSQPRSPGRRSRSRERRQRRSRSLSF